MRRFRVHPLPPPGGQTLLPIAVSHHLLRVVGIGRGEAVGLFDGEGGAAGGVLLDVVGGQALVLVGAHTVPPPSAPIWLLQGLPKHDAFDTIVRMATELGTTHIWPILAARTVARGDRRDRWTRISEAAAAQCGRAEVPEIGAPMTLSAALLALPAEVSGRVFVPGAPAEPPTPGPTALLLGPEGGLTEEEIDLALSAGFQAEGLGGRILRADTAAAAALARRGA